MIRLNKHIINVIAAMAVGLVCGCTNEGKAVQTDTGSIAFDSIVVDTVAMLDNDNPEMKVTVNMSIKYAKDNNAINKAIMGSGIFFPEGVVVPGNNLKEVMTNYMRQYVADYKEDYNSIYRFEPEGSKPLKAEHRVSTDIVGGSANTFAYQATVYQYAGGGEGSTSRVIMNFDKKTGNRIQLSDVLVPGYEEVLTDAVVEELCKRLEVKDLAGLRGKMYFYGVTPYLSDDFILTDDDITFVYAQDEIAEHDQGEVRVKIEIGKLKSFSAEASSGKAGGK